MFSRWLPVGNVRHDALADIVAGPAMARTATTLAEHFRGVRCGTVWPERWVSAEL
nr:hypothetical protein [Kibdelosporangium sp. MJ126-NF4]